MSKLKLLICLVGCLVSSGLLAQQNIQTFVKNFTSFQQNNPTEKVFLHLDKTEYAQAETIWIKAYLLAGAGHLPSPFSKNLYVELVAEDETVHERLTLRVEDGFATASLLIERAIPQGNYYLRAYTHWMKNQGPDYFFNKKIKIRSLDPNEEIVAQANTTPVQLRFFPEGGNMIKGVPGRVAFELIGLPDDQIHKGEIFNGQGQAVAEWATQHETRGVFDFTPEAGPYYAKIEGRSETFDLPEVMNEGIAMMANAADEAFINVVLKSNAPYQDNLNVVAHTRGYVTHASQTKINGERGRVQIPKTELPEGITTITLFDKDFQPLAERLVFIDKKEALNIVVTTDQFTYTPRERIQAKVKVRDANGRAVKGAFSLSVFDPGLVQNDQFDHNIRAYMLLSSDLKGHVKKPSQYFEGDEVALQNLDLLMMVNGWRRFSWDEVDPVKEASFPVELSLSVKGKLLKNSGGKIKSGGKVFLTQSGGSMDEARFVITDNKGNFQFDELHFYDTTTMVLQGFHKGGIKNTRFAMDSSFDLMPLQPYNLAPTLETAAKLQAFKAYARTAIFVDSTYRRVNGITYLGDVEVVADKRKERYRVLQSQYGEGENYVNFDEISLEEKVGRDPFRLMMGRVPGFTLFSGRPTGSGVQNQSDSSFFKPGLRSPRLRGGPFVGDPLIFIDNIEMTIEDVYDLRAKDIDYVEVYKSATASMFGSRGASGAIAFYTLKGKKVFEQINKPGMLQTRLKGYHVVREFYAPVYDKTNRQQYIPDQRATLFWAPMIRTNEFGEATVDFYAPDQSTYAYIDIQGITFDGKLGNGNGGFTIAKEQ